MMGAVNTLAHRQALPDGKGAGWISRNRQSWLGTAGPSDCGYARWFRVCGWFAVGRDQPMGELLAFPAGLLSTRISPWENFWLVVDGRNRIIQTGEPGASASGLPNKQWNEREREVELENFYFPRVVI